MIVANEMKLVDRWSNYLKSNCDIDDTWDGICSSAVRLFLQWGKMQGFCLESFLTGEDHERQQRDYFPAVDAGDDKTVEPKV